METELIVARKLFICLLTESCWFESFYDVLSSDVSMLFTPPFVSLSLTSPCGLQPLSPTLSLHAAPSSLLNSLPPSLSLYGEVMSLAQMMSELQTLWARLRAVNHNRRGGRKQL